MDLVLAHEQEIDRDGCGETATRTIRLEEDSLLGLALRQPLLTTPLRFALFGFLPDARLLVVSPPLQFPEEPFPRKLFLRDFERLLDVVVEDFDFHSSRFRTFPGNACANFGLAPDRLRGEV